MASYKTCAVPLCKSTTIRNPGKLFIHVPKCVKRRNQWIMLARRNPDVTSQNATIYFCEDHFDLPHDMENYMEYKIMGFISQIRMKPNCLPSKFECQPDRQKRMATITHTQKRSVAIKRQQRDIVKSILEESELQPSLGSTNTTIIDINKGYSPKIIKMTGTYNDFPDRLFLLKTDLEEISVPCYDLAQHQIDGIRFLFKQYKKLKQGVILNYASGCGASTQVTIFINAIHTDLQKPLLILYDKETEKKEWLERFKKWTTISADSIVVDSPKAFVKQPIHLYNIANVDRICGRQWSIVIVKSDEVDHKFMKFQLKVDFKIWITSVDMKKDETALNVIYTWMFNKSNPLINKYLVHKTGSKESFINNILLNTLLEDVLLTRRDLTPFRASKRQYEPEIKVAPKVSRKNKDATGLKIKRTKRSVDAPTTSMSHLPNLESNQSIKPEAIDIKIENEDEETKLDVESFIRDNEPLESDSNLSMAVRNIDDAAHTSLSTNVKTEDASTDSFVMSSSMEKILNMDNIDQRTKLSVELINDISQESITVGNEIEVESGRNSNLSNTMSVKDFSRSSPVSQSLFEFSNGSSQESLVVDNKMKVEAGNESVLSNPLLIQDTSSSSQNSQCEYLEFGMSSSQESDAIGNDEEIETGRECDTTNQMPKIKEIFSVAAENVSSDEESKHAIFTVKAGMSSDDSDAEEVIVDQDRKLELTTTVTQETEKSFDLKMRQVEERALKKFKGSFLDNMFKM